MADKYLLVCTVGGTSEPIIASIKHWQPQRIIFLPSRGTAHEIGDTILPRSDEEGFPVPPGCFDVYPLPDHQDFTACVKKIKERNGDVQKWLARGDEFKVVCDFTGGTKCMTAALALVAHRWKCLFSYVGGDRRTKDEVGVVVSGHENILHTQNPWDALGYQAVEEAVTLCDHGFHASAGMILEEARNKMTGSVKRELATMANLAGACAAWDRFDHEKAFELLKTVKGNVNDFLSLFGPETKEVLSSWVDRSVAYLGKLKKKNKPTQKLIYDLIANARRRGDQGRFDDAVARLYRTVEALAQLRLLDHGIENTGKVPLEKIPEPLKSQWAGRAKEGLVKLALQDDYVLLKAYGDPMADKFLDLRLEGKEKESQSPLGGRNDSILAHGFSPVRTAVYEQLWRACLALSGVNEEDLPHFPKSVLPSQ